MNRNKVIIVLLIMLSVSVISLYTTYAYEENNTITEKPSDSKYNLRYSLTETSNKEIVISAKEEKFIDLSLTNTYDATVKYGMYYYLINPTSLPEGVTITLAEDSVGSLEDTIKSQETKNISIRITNDSEYTLDLIIGALIGFEKGEISDLITDGEVLIK